MKYKSFMDRVVDSNPKDPLVDIDVEIDAWHRSTTDLSLIEWLGMTEEEYRRFLNDSRSLRQIIQSRKSS